MRLSSLDRIRLAVALAAAATASSGCGSRPSPAPVQPEPAQRGRDASAPRPVRVLRGKAVWYGGKWHGRRTASGERFDKHALTAAHRTLPLGTRIRVTNLENRRTLVLRVNDRGPYGRDRSRIIDVTEAAARRLGFRERGWVRVEVEVLADQATRHGRDAPPAKRRR